MGWNARNLKSSQNLKMFCSNIYFGYVKLIKSTFYWSRPQHLKSDEEFWTLLNKTSRVVTVDAVEQYAV